jgi:hypothetical protein
MPFGPCAYRAFRITFADPEKIRELARRGEAWGDSKSCFLRRPSGRLRWAWVVGSVGLSRRTRTVYCHIYGTIDTKFISRSRI